MNSFLLFLPELNILFRARVKISRRKNKPEKNNKITIKITLNGFAKITHEGQKNEVNKKWI